MTKLDIYGGLLGAGKTTLIRAMLQCAYRGKRVAVIENEIGRVNLDAGAFSGVTVRPLTAGCVCCTLKGDLVTAVRELVQSVAPDYIVMEASGAADLEAIRRICEEIDAVALNRCVMVVNARKLRKLMTVVGEFYRIQLRDATDIYLNFTEGLPQAELDAVRQLLWDINPNARLIDTPIDRLEADTLPEGDVPTTPGFKPVPVRALKGQRADAAEGSRPTLKVLEQAPLPDVLPADRFLRDFGSPAPGKHSAPGIRAFDTGKTLFTLTLRIPAPLTQQDLERLRQRLDRGGIWRAKGFATMSDGSVVKLDYAFGDFFTAPAPPDTAAALDTLVLIGEDKQALSQADATERFFGGRAPGQMD